MKVKVNIINMWCTPMSEAVTVPSLMMRTSTVSEESLVRDTHTHTQRHTHPLTHTHSLDSTLKFAKSLMTLQTKRCLPRTSLHLYFHLLPIPQPHNNIYPWPCLQSALQLSEVLKERDAQMELKHLKARASEGQDSEWLEKSRREYEDSIRRDQEAAMKRMMAADQNAGFIQKQYVFPFLFCSVHSSSSSCRCINYSFVLVFALSSDCFRGFKLFS